MARDGDLTFAIIGAGMSGILAAIKLRDAGFEFTVYEKASTVGGTWRENTYPGIACDVPSHIYSYSFDLNPEWGYLCSPGAEIQAYFEDVARRYEIEPHIRFDDAITRCEWTADGRWRVETASGHTNTVDMVIAATGILHHPNVPDLEGLETFAGPSFHSARWDHDVDVEGKRVGLVGTGSSGVQITGALAGVAGHLTVFQRTAQWVVPVDQVAYSEEEKDAWRTDADLLRELHESMAREFNDGFATSILDGDSEMVLGIEQLCTDYLDREIADPELREKLRPDYRAACKRLVVSHNFYDAIVNPDVTLVDAGVERVEPAGVVDANGTCHELDVLVLATGFKVDRFMRPMDIAGRNGILLDDVWSERPSAYLAVAVPEFPNFFMLNGPNSPVGNFSLIQTAEMQMDYVMQLVDLVRSGQLTEAVPTVRAATRFEEERVVAAKKTVWATGCRSWYLDDRGIPFAWPFPFARFRNEMSEPKLGDYEVAGR